VKNSGKTASENAVFVELKKPKKKRKKALFFFRKKAVFSIFGGREK